jgi:hypothetical protein
MGSFALTWKSKSKDGILDNKKEEIIKACIVYNLSMHFSKEDINIPNR